MLTLSQLHTRADRQRRTTPWLALAAALGLWAGACWLTGCAIFSSPFDSVEYGMLNDAAGLIEQTKAQCADPPAALASASNALQHMVRLSSYAAPIPGDDDVAKASAELEKLSRELVTHLAGTYSPAYCEIKTTELAKGMRTLQGVMATRKHA